MWMKQQWIQRRKTHPKKIITKCKLNAKAAFDLFSCSFLSCNVKDGQMQTMAKFIIILDIAVVHFRQTYFAEFSCWGYRISRIQNWKANFWFTFRIFSMIKCVFFCIIYLLKEKFYFPSHLNFSFAGVNLLKISIVYKVKIKFRFFIWQKCPIKHMKLYNPGIFIRSRFHAVQDSVLNSRVHTHPTIATHPSS